MADINITTMSSKGQIVIPKDMRKGFKEGEKLILIKNKGRILMKKADNIDENFQEDIEFAQRTEAALQRIEKGKGIRMSMDDFLEDMEKW
jgi:AbrB family looped-hinge helix DNA binding protein